MQPIFSVAQVTKAIVCGCFPKNGVGITDSFSFVRGSYSTLIHTQYGSALVVCECV